MNSSNTKTIDDWILFFESEVPNHVTDSRWEHIKRVAFIANQLAEVHFFPEPKKAYLAGLIHDTTKQKKWEVHETLFSEFSVNVMGIPKQAYHAYSVTLFLQKEFGFYDKEIHSAIQNHTLGSGSPSLLDQIVYAADFLGSDFCQNHMDLPNWIQKTHENINFGIFMKAFQTISFLLEKKEAIHPNTIFTYNHALQSLKEIK